MSVVALSMAFGFNAEYTKTQPAVNPIPIGVEEKRLLGINVNTVGAVKESSIERVKELLCYYLTDKVKNLLSEDNYITIIEGSNMYDYARQSLKIDPEGMYDGMKVNVPKKKGIQIFCAEALIEQFIPVVAQSINKYYENAS